MERRDLLPPFKGAAGKDCSKRLLEDLGKFSDLVEKDYGVRQVRWASTKDGGLEMHFQMPDNQRFTCEFTGEQVEQVQGGLQYQTFFRQMDSGLRAHIAEWDRQRKLERLASAPDIGEYVIGYRQWKLDPNSAVLHPQSRGRVWAVGQWSEAVCDQPPVESPGSHGGFFVPSNSKTHLAPDPNCECGLYALHEPPCASSATQVSGAVIAKGLIEVHNTGFRAQFAKPILFSLPTEQSSVSTRVHALAKLHGIQAVPFENLRDAAREWGRPIPESEYPSNHEPEFFM